MAFTTSSRAIAGIIAFAAIATGCSTDTTDTQISSVAPSPAPGSSAPGTHASAHSAPPPPAVPPVPGGDTAGATTTGVETSPGAEHPADPNEPSAAGTYYGDGYNGLAVFAFGPDCATAMTVQSAFGTRRGTGDTGTITLDAAGRQWICGEGTSPVPYLECASDIGAVRLTS